MKIQVKIMAIFILFFAFAIIACTPGGWGTDKNPTNTVMYNGNTNTDGTVPIDTNTYLPTFTVTVLGNGTLTNTGYTFAGWNTQADGNGTDRAPASTFAIGSSNVILYAKWTTLPTHAVTYAANGGGGGVPADSNNYLAGAAVTVLGNGTLTMAGGYSFTCWNTQADGNGTDRAPASTFAMGSSNVILYAKWTTLPTYTVTYDANGGSGGVPADSNNYLAGATVTVLGNGTLTMAGGYSFTCWNTQADGNGTDSAPASTFAIGSANVILYAKWTTLPTHTVTYAANGGSGGLPADSNNYLAGAAVTVQGSGTLTNPGYVFASWNTQADGSGTALAPAATFAIGSSNVVLYAKWTALPTYTVTYNNATGGNGVPPVDSNSYLSGATVTVLGGCGWNTQADGSGTALAPAATFAMGSSNVTLYAQCSVNQVYGGLLSSGLGPPYACHCDNLYVMQNYSCRLCPTGWTYSNGACTCTKSKTNNCSTVPFVSYSGNGGSGGLPFDGNTYLPGVTVTVLGIGTLTKLGYTFAGWNTQADGSGTALAPAATFTMGSSNVVLYAQWTH